MEQLGEFTLGEQIGGGPYSTVYLASSGAEQYALRVLNPDAVPAEAGQREAMLAVFEALCHVAHPSIVRVKEAGEESGRVYLAMELMKSPTLAERLDSGEVFAEKQAILFVRQAAQALDKARDLGFFHGNLHSGNVFIVSDERVKLSDFAVGAIVAEPTICSEPPRDEPQESNETVADLLRSGQPLQVGPERLQQDFLGLALLTVEMLGVNVPAWEEQESERQYCERLVREVCPQMADSEQSISAHTVEIVRGLLTPGAFESPGELVVELASAMLLRGSARGPSVHGAGAVGALSTMQVSVEDDESSFWTVPAAEDLPELDSEDQGAADAAAPSELTAFYIWDGAHAGRFFVVREGESIHIGRDPDFAEVVLMDPAISRQHCQISRSDGRIYVEDPGSTNGTFVNGERIDSVELGLRDVLRVGATRIYRSISGRDEGR